MINLDDKTILNPENVISAEQINSMYKLTLVNGKIVYVSKEIYDDIITYEPGTAPVLQDKTVTPTTSSQTVTADEGYDGLGTVNVSAVTSTIDNNIQAGNIKKDISILGVTGSYEGSGLVIPAVTNLSCNDSLIASWTAPDLSDLAVFNPVVSYLVSVDDVVAGTVSTTSIDLSNTAIANNSVITVVVKVLLTSLEEAEYTYSAPYSVALLASTMSKRLMLLQIGRYNTDIYVLGGQTGTASSDTSNVIIKFDILSETTTTLETTFQSLSSAAYATVGSNIYTFGGNSAGSRIGAIYKFDTTNETYSSLGNMGGQLYKNQTASAVGTYIYIFGGQTSSSKYIIFKYDTTSNTLTTLSTILPRASLSLTSAKYNTNIYIFDTENKKIYKFDTTNETISTLTTTLDYTTRLTCDTIGTDIYLFNTVENNNSTILKFDTQSETLTTLNIFLPSFISDGAKCIAYNNTIYIFGGYSNNNNNIINKIQKFVVN